MSESSPKHLPSTRTGRIFAAQSMPAVQTASLLLAAMIPAVDVPCQLLVAMSQPSNVCELIRSLRVIQSPGSDASASRPSPSLATLGSEMKSYPGRMRPAIAA